MCLPSVWIRLPVEPSVWRFSVGVSPWIRITGNLSDGTHFSGRALIRWDEKAGLQRDAIRSQ